MEFINDRFYLKESFKLRIANINSSSPSPPHFDLLFHNTETLGFQWKLLEEESKNPFGAEYLLHTHT